MIHIDTIHPVRATVISMISAILSTFNVDIILQRGAWIMAIISACVAIYNGTRSWFKKNRK